MYLPGPCHGPSFASGVLNAQVRSRGVLDAPVGASGHETMTAMMRP